MRIVKDPIERRQEILDVAQSLFVTKGYHKTTIVDILKAVGIAKGTFYYYFVSKEEVMDAIIKRVIDEDVAKAEETVKRTDLTPIEKLFVILLGQRPQRDEVKGQMIEQFHQPNNAEMHQKSITMSIHQMAPILADVIEEGIEKSLFTTEYPRETVELLVVAAQIIFDEGMFQWEPEEMLQRVKAFVKMMETSLGATQGSFDQMYDYILNQ